MSDKIKVRGLNGDNATLLLAAAQELGLPADVVRTAPTEGVFVVPAEVADKAGFDENGLPAKRAAKKAAAEQQKAEEGQQDQTVPEAPAEAESKPARTPRKRAAKKAAAPTQDKE